MTTREKPPTDEGACAACRTLGRESCVRHQTPFGPAAPSALSSSPSKEIKAAIARTTLMASSDPKWDLSPKDRGALRLLVSRLKLMEDVASGRAAALAAKVGEATAREPVSPAVKRRIALLVRALTLACDGWNSALGPGAPSVDSLREQCLERAEGGPDPVAPPMPPADAIRERERIRRHGLSTALTEIVAHAEKGLKASQKDHRYREILRVAASALSLPSEETPLAPERLCECGQPIPAPSFKTCLLCAPVTFVVNGEEVEVRMRPEMWLLSGMQVALAKSGHVNRPIEDWEIRNTLGTTQALHSRVDSVEPDVGLLFYLTIKIGGGGAQRGCSVSRLDQPRWRCLLREGHPGDCAGKLVRGAETPTEGTRSDLEEAGSAKETIVSAAIAMVDADCSACVTPWDAVKVFLDHLQPILVAVAAYRKLLPKAEMRHVR